MRILQMIAVFAVLSTGIAAQHPHESAPAERGAESEKTYLLDEFGALGHCDLTSRFDTMFHELSDRASDAHAHVIFYKAANALPARLDTASYMRLFQSHLAFRNFDASRVTVVDGGFKEELRTEIWIVRPGGLPPQPSKTIDAPKIATDQTLKYDVLYIGGDETGELLQEFELPSVRAEREAQQAEMEAEIRASESAESENLNEDVPDEKPAEEMEAETESEEYVDKRTPEEIEADRFSWTSEKFGKFVASNKSARGVMIFYADDQTYDTSQLQHFIEQGRKRIAEAEGISPDRIAIEFGGYRGMVEVEYWFVPENGQQPIATPDERPVEEAEPIEEFEGQDG